MYIVVPIYIANVQKKKIWIDLHAVQQKIGDIILYLTCIAHRSLQWASDGIEDVVDDAYQGCNSLLTTFFNMYHII